jgi:hypothetical protein
VDALAVARDSVELVRPDLVALTAPDRKERFDARTPEYWPRRASTLFRIGWTSLQRSRAQWLRKRHQVRSWWGASISPDGAYGAAWTFLPTAGYLMDDLFIRNGDRWDMHGGGSGGGISWSALGEDDRGVLRYGHEAPDGVSTACVKYGGRSTACRFDTGTSCS